MKLQKFLILAVVLCAFLNLSMEWDYGYGILTSSDFDTQRNQDRHALSAALDDPDYWESYNLWQCFPKEEIEINCIKVCYKDKCIANEDWSDSLTFLAQPSDGALYEFSFDDDHERSCNQTMEIWWPLLNGQQAVCLYAAYLQDFDVSSEENIKRHSYWVIDRFKTLAGQYSSSDYASPEIQSDYDDEQH
ncbi:MAG: hypothetical protein A2Z91_02230 [Deltaproteobacteria bacterium GWA2_38_16]|nr:MAG: hypothetical protein A2Z91_02230 [Deltaproteobacteria bacterium GWA2_38_16]OGQ02014.1 MAG: hypothetical protein A3D19_08525 [Deltaproteobacteria bacterium RIFCSPHIGHO2_02_FULL_38_15]OGQ33704.1 MAG: hypothetical protein A3A72_05785 [Deltaproteobacteria bacterium RIFCSPLOWO2_01_FULL_38_9]OGQ61064.1 MAG: hypothetical protein A3G92_01995 [Deltaproteobacteria bacterium RIFCSPLOWO2_12_FULL_38_8]HBQ21547.1 hypothetical protein [Deltaproteobacteria bacterium]